MPSPRTPAASALQTITCETSLTPRQFHSEVEQSLTTDPRFNELFLADPENWILRVQGMALHGEIILNFIRWRNRFRVSFHFWKADASVVAQLRRSLGRILYLCKVSPTSLSDNKRNQRAGPFLSHYLADVGQQTWALGNLRITQSAIESAWTCAWKDETTLNKALIRLAGAAWKLQTERTFDETEVGQVAELMAEYPPARLIWHHGVRLPLIHRLHVSVPQMPHQLRISFARDRTSGEMIIGWIDECTKHK